MSHISLSRKSPPVNAESAPKAFSGAAIAASISLRPSVSVAGVAHSCTFNRRGAGAEPKLDPTGEPIEASPVVDEGVRTSA